MWQAGHLLRVVGNRPVASVSCCCCVALSLVALIASATVGNEEDTAVIGVAVTNGGSSSPADGVIAVPTFSYSAIINTNT